MAQKLITFSSQYIIDFTAKNPIDWQGKAFADRGGCGDLLTPTPAVLEFLALLKEKNSLFTQDEYADYCINSPVWQDWLDKQGPKSRKGRVCSVDDQRVGIRYRLKRNFYPSMVDTLHAWAILSEAQWFDVCLIDTFDDVVGKVDLSLIRGKFITKIALIGPGRAKQDREYKKLHRCNGDSLQDVIEIVMPYERPRGAGNKRWFQLGDFEIIRELESTPVPILEPEPEQLEMFSLLERLEAAAHEHEHSYYND